jgi:phosphotransferase system  glucose/maltose/N-acetylglucosamine-specific IIC component
LDYLVVHDQLRSEGYKSTDVHIAISISGNDATTAKQFLQGFVSLCELGFPSNAVAEALKVKNNNKEAALEVLLSQ